MNRNLFACAVAVLIAAVCAIALVAWPRPHIYVSTASSATSTQLGAVSQSNPTTTAQTTTTAIKSKSTSTPSSLASVWGEYHVNAPNALMLVDSQGRRTGKDPATGTFYHEIPGTSYTEEGNSPAHISGELFTQDLPNGQYRLYVLGGQTGPYWLDANHYGQAHQIFQGDIQSGEMIAYMQNYDTAKLASSTFVLQGTVSSTASVTTAPPNNLPPPPVP